MQESYPSPTPAAIKNDLEEALETGSLPHWQSYYETLVGTHLSVPKGSRLQMRRECEDIVIEEYSGSSWGHFYVAYRKSTSESILRAESFNCRGSEPVRDEHTVDFSSSLWSVLEGLAREWEKPLTRIHPEKKYCDNAPKTMCDSCTLATNVHPNRGVKVPVSQPLG